LPQQPENHVNVGVGDSTAVESSLLGKPVGHTATHHKDGDSRESDIRDLEGSGLLTCGEKGPEQSLILIALEDNPSAVQRRQ
jgi:hypothetical protein